MGVLSVEHIDADLIIVYPFTIIPAPWFKRHRDNPQLKAFVDGATAAATGATTGAVIVLGARAIVDPPTATMDS
jgi:chromate transporter